MSALKYVKTCSSSTSSAAPGSVRRCFTRVPTSSHVCHASKLPGRQRSSHWFVQAVADPEEPALKQQRVAAELAVDRYVRSGHIVGLGSGPMVSTATAYLAQQIERGSLQDIRAVPGSDSAAREATFHELPLMDLGSASKVDTTLQQVDLIDELQLAAVVGVSDKPQQPQLSKLQMLAGASQQLIALVDDLQRVVPRLGGNIPVLIDGDTWEDTAEELDDLLIGDAEVWRRSNSPTVSARAPDDPYITDEGDNIVDLKFRKPMVQPQEDIPLVLQGEEVPYEELVQEIEAIDGVKGHGILLSTVVSAAIVATDGGPRTLTAPQQAVAGDESSS